MTEAAESEGRISPGEEVLDRLRRRTGLLLGPALLLVFLCWPSPTQSFQHKALVATVLLVLTWWITEAVPAAVTALLGPSLLVVFGVDTPAAVFSPFADPVIFLFLGSFILAQAIVASGLDRRAAITFLSRSRLGPSPGRVLVASGILVAGLSMWLSNTATAAMMYPLALALTRAENRDNSRFFASPLLLTVAYAASIGGLGTPVGTPPNLIALGQLEKLAGVKVGFLQWMGIGLPAATAMLFLCLWRFRRLVVRRGHTVQFQDLKADRRPLSRQQKNVLVAFSLAVSFWLLPGTCSLLLSPQHPLARTLTRAAPEGVVAIVAASLLFLMPVDWRAGRFTLTWREAAQVDWGTLLLFGGGLSLGNQLFKSGLASQLGRWLVEITGAATPLSLAYLFAFLALVLTETTSNTAAATVTCPLAIAAAQAAGVSPTAPALAAAVAASLAFMLPISTPPNAIVYGSGLIRITEMVVHGLWLDLVGIAITPPLVVALCAFWGLG
ncbi:MAG: SLC13 family permease [Thermoanaerobaculaceae bacterium]